ncbi:MAG: response regulator [Melioribacteraceae bacterium]|nr:response regulator [Melioribacteraceae bacterium]
MGNTKLIITARILSLVAFVIGVITLFIELSFYSDFTQIVVIGRIIPILGALICFVLTFLKPTKKQIEVPIHILLFSIVISFGVITFFVPANLILNLVIGASVFFAVSMILKMSLINQFTSAAYYYLVFGGVLFLKMDLLKNSPDFLLCLISVLVLGILSAVINLALGTQLTEASSSLSSAKREVPLDDSENMYHEIVTHADFGVFRSYINGKLVFHNQALLKVLGYTESEDLENFNFGKEIYANEDEKEKFLKLLERQKKVKNYRIKLKKKNGDTLKAKISARLILDKDNNPYMFEGSLLDISQQVKKEKDSKNALETLKKEKYNAIADMKLALERSEIKTQFLASMSHEIRTPMNSVLGFLTLIENELFESKEELQQFAGNARTSSESLLDIINNILDISKIEAGKMELDEQDFNVSDELAKAESIVMSGAKEKGIDLIFSIDPKIPSLVLGDNTRFRQIIVNLMGNAVKFTEKGSVELILQLVESDIEKMKIEGTVKDSGPGIAPDKLEKLFNPYSQVKGDSPIKNQGAGLGLMICKEFVNMMGGDINVESEVGVGSTFNFSIYFKQSAGQEINIFKKEDPDISKKTIELSEPELKESMNNLKEELKAENAEAAFPRIPLSRRSKKRLLLVEDNPISQSVELKLLREVGYLVDAVSNGEEAIMAVKTGAFDLVLMDIEMAGMDGITATREIRNLEEGPSNIPIIAVTANSSMKDRERCLAAEMNDYIAKPININFLKMTIDRWLNAN